MSVSSMLSGPSRERPVAAYSPPATSSAGTALGGAPTPVVSSVPGPGASAATPQPPVMPPTHSPFASKPPTANSTSATTSTAPPAPSSSAAAAATSAAAAPVAPAPVERSSYPPLPSAFARESPYAPAPSASPITTPAATTAPPPLAAAAKSAQQNSFPSSPSTWGSASAALAHAQAQAQQAKESLFPGASVGGAAATGGGQRAGPGPQNAPSRAGPGASSAALGGGQNGGHAAAGSTTGSGSGGGSFAWQAQAAQQAQQVQRERERERELQYGQQGPKVGQGTSGLRGQTAPHQHSSTLQSPANRFSGSQDPYSASRGQASPANGQASTASAAAGHKRRRSELGSIAANGSGIDQTLPSTPQTVSAAAQAEAIPATPPPPAAPALPLFSYSDQRKASVRPPMIEVVNDAVDAWVRRHGAELAGEKAARPERSCLGRVVYDALVPPAKLLDGDVLAQGVGGYVEVIVPATWIVGPTSAAAAASEIHSSCSVPPIDLPPVAFSVGPPSAYTGAPLPQTSPSTPLALPTHLADLPGFRKRQVWGTDVYTDDSDILALLVHSGWLRVTRRERRRRAGQRGAGADAIRRARVVGEERIETVQSAPAAAEGGEATPASARAIKVTLGVVPPLIRYQGIERQGIRSRSWGNGHDGVSLRVEKVELLAVS